VLELCGVDPPKKNPLDGRSFAKVLRDASAEFAPVRFWQWNRGRPNYTHNAAVREGRFKLIRPFVTRRDKPRDSKRPVVLYDLEADPAEAVDVAGQHPEVVRRMVDSLRRWSEAMVQDRLRPEYTEGPTGR